jgi:predicted nuclease with TOPRIM domain
MKDVRKHKQLKSQLNNAEADLEALKIEVSNKQRELSQVQKNIDVLKYQMSKLNNNDNLKVSEHAIVRYFERVKGFDIEAIEKEILSDSVIELVDKLGGSGSYPNAEYSVVMKNYTVVTLK